MDSDQTYLITITKYNGSQLDLHNYMINKYPTAIVITQQEPHKSGVPHFHIFLKSSSPYASLKQYVNELNPPINERTNDVIITDSEVGTLKYVTKHIKQNEPIFYGITRDEVMSLVSKYKHAKNLQQRKAIKIIKNRVKCLNFDVYQYYLQGRAQQIDELKKRMEKLDSLLSIFDQIGDFDAIADVLQQLEILKSQIRELSYTPDQIYSAYKQFSNPIYNAN